MLPLSIHYSDWVEFEMLGEGDRIIPLDEYSPNDYGHNSDGTYSHPGAGGVYMNDTVRKFKGWCWSYNDPSEIDFIWSGPHKTKQDAFDEAFEILFAQFGKEHRVGVAGDWEEYCKQNKLRLSTLRRTLDAIPDGWEDK